MFVFACDQNIFSEHGDKEATGQATILTALSFSCGEAEGKFWIIRWITGEERNNLALLTDTLRDPFCLEYPAAVTFSSDNFGEIRYESLMQIQGRVSDI